MEAIIREFLILLILGGIGGMLAGLLGVGGGIIYVLIFSYYLPIVGVPNDLIVPAIVANSMFAILFAGLSGSYKQWRNNNFFPNDFLIIGIAASIASIFFSYLIGLGQWYTQEKFTYFFIALLGFICLRLFKTKPETESTKEIIVKPKHFVFTGFVSGTIAAFSGVGGGVIIVPILTTLLKLPIKKATSISLGVISVMAFFTSIYNLFFQELSLNISAAHIGMIVFSVSIPVALGSLLFSPLGVSVSSKLKPSSIRLIFVTFVILVLSKMIYSIL